MKFQHICYVALQGLNWGLALCGIGTEVVEVESGVCCKILWIYGSAEQEV